jgi:hypothetical protein
MDALHMLGMLRCDEEVIEEEEEEDGDTKKKKKKLKTKWSYYLGRDFDRDTLLSMGPPPPEDIPF